MDKIIHQVHAEHPVPGSCSTSVRSFTASQKWQRRGDWFYGRTASMTWGVAENLPEQNKNNKCVSRSLGATVKKYAGTYVLLCTNKSNRYGMRE